MIRIAALLFTTTLFLGCTQKQLPQPVSEEIELSQEIKWDNFENEIKKMSGNILLNKIREAQASFKEQPYKSKIEQLYNDAAQDFLAQEIVRLLSEKKQNPTIAIMNFNAIGGYPSTEGEEIAQQLITDLAGNTSLSIVERSKLEELLREQRLTTSDYFDENRQINMGKLAGADIIVSGTLGKKIYVKILNTETGILSGAVQIDRLHYLLDSDKNENLWQELGNIESGNNEYGLRVWTEKKKYKIGDSIVFKCSAEKDCYITIISMQSDGSLTQLIPNPFSNMNYIRKGQIVQLPSQKDAFEIVVEPPVGPQRVKAIASSKPLNFIPGTKKSGGFRSVADPETGYQLTRDLKIKLKKEKAVKWAESSWTFEITE